MFGSLEPPGGWPGWLRAYLQLAWTAHPQQQWMVAEIGRSLVLLSDAPNGWANAFVLEAGGYGRFGYNVHERRWAYGITPRQSVQVAQAIATFNGY